MHFVLCEHPVIGVTERPSTDAIARLACTTIVSANVPYKSSGDPMCRLDLYRPADVTEHAPTLMFLHGGGWAADAWKESWCLWFLPFLAHGWIVANVDYRPAQIACAPAAAEDCMEALDWLRANAPAYGIDAHQIVIGGLSAGGLLALLTGFEAGARYSEALERHHGPAAIINWCGITDVAQLLAGPHRQAFAVDWIGDGPDARVHAVSPLVMAHEHAPPVITLHGTHDRVVPFSQATRLHDRLAELGVRQRLIPLEGADHATLDAHARAYRDVFAFLGELEITTQASSSRDQRDV